ncbi:universal stress protein [Halosolutus gelatinilyticus]|uniref:universal stress protein n=1 Tax=Halosolutus gelatinilyticus TaxID=2931975 RepID=UPI001FF26434|nr:universal stress protein [Halosolutus gelatinilyticus]
MRYFLGTDSVHTTAAACDYLDDRATADDEVTAVAVAPPDDRAAERDRQEALNVAPVRLSAVGSVETELREGEPTAELLAAASEVGADEIVIGARSGAPDATADLGSTARRLLENASRPVIVVPIPDL